MGVGVVLQEAVVASTADLAEWPLAVHLEAVQQAASASAALALAHPGQAVAVSSFGRQAAACPVAEAHTILVWQRLAAKSVAVALAAMAVALALAVAAAALVAGRTVGQPWEQELRRRWRHAALALCAAALPLAAPQQARPSLTMTMMAPRPTAAAASRSSPPAASAAFLQLMLAAVLQLMLAAVLQVVAADVGAEAQALILAAAVKALAAKTSSLAAAAAVAVTSTT